ncbi:glycosyltransferase family 4 protein [Methylobacterium sp. BTF04]|uniref:glycosyltransferase family 4 protein n=1 Tax=Methylobacterium sp. BTF04 TaxID=2708300 RepID=UPI0013D7AC41|nr:glycosyltransferase family 4 protein [Methylobacterium sp. BTF04]NEU14475.1 glycosyltransferase family 4 protein [Methylobacterium sp. BTF04]
MKIAYFVHDLTDPAVERRIRMFRAGGAKVLLTGFYRGSAPEQIDGIVPFPLGETADARLISRLMMTLGQMLRGRWLASCVAGADVIVARNLEMLAIARSARGSRSSVPLVYECLDIHRLMLSERPVGFGLRTIEGYLARKASALVTSSPAFVDEYFSSRSKVDLPVILVENKVFLDGSAASAPAMTTPSGCGPWRIGWFGAIRCLKSFRILSEVTRRLNGRLNVVIRGRPAYSEFPDFDVMVEREPFICFHGPYRNPDDLTAIYAEVDFAWVIDLFEEGLNSEWLLPNRLYESGWTGTIPIARQSTATGQWLARHDAGIRLNDNLIDDLVRCFLELDSTKIDDLAAGIAGIDRSAWVCTAEECRALNDRLMKCAVRATSHG